MTHGPYREAPNIYNCSRFMMMIDNTERNNNYHHERHENGKANEQPGGDHFWCLCRCLADLD
jgi:hypothetical protein